MSVSIFTETSDFIQVSEILQYFQDNERCIDVTMEGEEWLPTLKVIIANIDLIFEDKISDTDMGGIINSIVSLILLMQPDIQGEFVEAFCKVLEKKMCNNDKKERIKRFVLSSLFLGLTVNELKIKTYESLLNAEINSDKKHLININLKEISGWLKEWQCNQEQTQNILSKLNRIFIERHEERYATESMMMLLSSFTDDRAATARDDAIRCIVAALQDPNALTMDQILELKPVQCLAGEAIHDLLSIFVSGTINDYRKFLNDHPDFMDKYELDKEACLTKIRILSLMTLAAGDTTELSYDTIQKELQLERDELEAFVIEAVRQQAVTCKLDQQNEKVLISGAVPRSFGPDQWTKLYRDLQMWQNNFKIITEDLRKLRSGTEV